MRDYSPPTNEERDANERWSTAILSRKLLEDTLTPFELECLREVGKPTYRDVRQLG